MPPHHWPSNGSHTFMSVLIEREIPPCPASLSAVLLQSVMEEEEKIAKKLAAKMMKTMRAYFSKRAKLQTKLEELRAALPEDPAPAPPPTTTSTRSKDSAKEREKKKKEREKAKAAREKATAAIERCEEELEALREKYRADVNKIGDEYRAELGQLGSRDVSGEEYRRKRSQRKNEPKDGEGSGSASSKRES